MKPYLIIVFQDRKFVFCECGPYLSLNRNPNAKQLIESLAKAQSPDVPVSEVHWFDFLEDAASWVDAYPEVTYH